MRKDFLFSVQGKLKLKGASFQSKQTGYRKIEEVTFLIRGKLTLRKQGIEYCYIGLSLPELRPGICNSWIPSLIGGKSERSTNGLVTGGLKERE